MPGSRGAPHSCLPVLLIRRELDLVQHEVDDAVQDVVLVPDVVVQRHRFHPERLAEPAHGHRLDPARVREANGGVEDSIPVQGHRLTSLRRTSNLRCTYEGDRAQALTIPVAAGAAVVIVILCSAVYSVLHYLF